MPGKITNLDATPKLFAGQSDLIIFGFKTGKSYDSANLSLADFDAPQSLGQIVQDSTSWDGDEAETTQIKDEQGDIITAKVTSGTQAFSFEMASTSKAIINKFLNAGKAGYDVSSINVEGFVAGVTATGFGCELPVFTAPIAIINDEGNRAFFYPKAKLVSSLSYSDGLWRIKVAATAEFIKTANLYTGMLLEGTAKYQSASN